VEVFDEKTLWRCENRKGSGYYSSLYLILSSFVLRTTQILAPNCADDNLRAEFGAKSDYGVDSHCSISRNHHVFTSGNNLVFSKNVFLFDNF
jgi:hypothetical protein